MKKKQIVFKVSVREKDNPGTVWSDIHVYAKDIFQAVLKAEEVLSKRHGMKLIACAVEETTLEVI